MDISHLTLSNVTFELRFGPAFALWDHSGEFWLGVRHNWTKLKTVEVNPTTLRFISDKHTELGLFLEKAHVLWNGTKFDEKEFIEYCKYFSDAARDVLEIESFTRIGLRQIYRKIYDTEEAAVDAFLSTGTFKPAQGRQFGIEGTLKEPSYAYRVEGEALGWGGRLAVQRRKILVEAPFGDPDIPEVDKERLELHYDVDYYTVAPITVGQFRAEDWIKQGLHVVRRDAKALLGG